MASEHRIGCRWFVAESVPLGGGGMAFLVKLGRGYEGPHLAGGGAGGAQTINLHRHGQQSQREDEMDAKRSDGKKMHNINLFPRGGGRLQ